MLSTTINSRFYKYIFLSIFTILQIYKNQNGLPEIVEVNHYLICIFIFYCIIFFNFTIIPLALILASMSLGKGMFLFIALFVFLSVSSIMLIQRRYIHALIFCTSFIFGIDDTPFISTVDIELIDIMKGVLELNETIGRIGLTACSMTRPHEFISSINLSDRQLKIYRDKIHEGHTYRLSGTWSLWNSKYFLLYLDKSDTLFDWEIHAL